MEEKMFEIVEAADDGQTPDHGYPISSHMSLWLRWAKNLKLHKDTLLANQAGSFFPKGPLSNLT